MHPLPSCPPQVGIFSEMELNMRLPVLLIAAFLAAPVLAADVKIENAWIREPAPGQPVMGGYMDITSDKDASLTQASSPAFGKIELHEMKMQGDVMQMREIGKLALPKGKTVRLEPGGLHMMLYAPKSMLKAGDKIPLTLVISSGGKTEKLETTAEVRSMQAPAHAPMNAPMHGH